MRILLLPLIIVSMLLAGCDGDDQVPLTPAQEAAIKSCPKGFDTTYRHWEGSDGKWYVSVTCYQSAL